MFKVCFLLLFGATALLAELQVQEFRFESGISFYGKVGTVELRYEEDLQKQHYKMKAVAKSTGIVKVLSGNREDSFISEGKIEKGIYKPERFIKTVSKNEYKSVTTYRFDYEKKRVYKTQKTERLYRHKDFDAVKFTFVEKEELRTKVKREDIPLYANDYLSLYLNLMHKNLKSGRLSYVDKNEKDRVLLLSNTLFEVQKNEGEDRYQILLINDEKSLFFKEARSLDVSFYGDAYIRRID